MTEGSPPLGDYRDPQPSQPGGDLALWGPRGPPAQQPASGGGLALGSLQGRPAQGRAEAFELLQGCGDSSSPAA